MCWDLLLVAVLMMWNMMSPLGWPLMLRLLIMESGISALLAAIVACRSNFKALCFERAAVWPCRTVTVNSQGKPGCLLIGPHRKCCCILRLKLLVWPMYALCPFCSLYTTYPPAVCGKLDIHALTEGPVVWHHQSTLG